MASGLYQSPLSGAQLRIGCPSFRSRVAWCVLVLACFALEAFATEHQLRSVSNSLEVFQVYPPVLTADEKGVLEITDGSSNASILAGGQQPVCRQTLVSYSFANSYGAPFVHAVSPPSCQFSRVTWNLTVTGAGRQFDRLAIVYLGDVEVFRTSTAEPTAAGIHWTYLKDMTPYLSLIKQPQTIIFDLGNIVDGTYTSPFNVTLTAVYFSAEDSVDAADLILPISARHGSQGKASVFSLPPDTASNNLVLPRNVKRAVVSVAATGQIDEEFWWSNVPSSTTNTFADGTLLGYSPFREVQLFIDDVLAGVAWPFPIIFTGGIVPGLWRPIVGIDAFDLKEDEIDITPWLGMLCDGQQHNFTIRVAGLVDDGKGNAQLAELVGSYWLVTGKVFIWYDTAGHITTGEGPSVRAPDPIFEVSTSTTKAQDGSNDTLSFEVSAERSLAYSAVINTSQGPKYVSWQQTRLFSNNGTLSGGGNVQNTGQDTSGYDISSGGYIRHFEYPLTVDSEYLTNADNFTIIANVTRAKRDRILGKPVFPTGQETLSTGANAIAGFQGVSLETSQNGSATYEANTTARTSYSSGSTSQSMTFSGLSLSGSITAVTLAAAALQELFTRQVAAVNGAIIYDHESLMNNTVVHVHSASHSQDDFLLSGRPQDPRQNIGLP